jgi:hypothetical protein
MAGKTDSLHVDLAQAMVMTPPAPADYLVVAPLVIGFVFGALCLMTRKNTDRQPWVALSGLALMLAADIGLFWHVWDNGTVVMTMGRWLPPFRHYLRRRHAGRDFRADRRHRRARRRHLRLAGRQPGPAGATVSIRSCC